jgi:carbon-monoxide dehydrogenase medium subunit
VKPAPFDYLRAASVAEAVAALAEVGDGSKVLAGGQSLLPMMNFRLARPEALVDIGGMSELRGVVSDNDFIEIGALTRHADLERSTLPGPVGTLLRSAGAQVGHLPIRTRGTFGGSLAHADPASEWCLLAVLLDATMAVTGPVGTRVVAAADFFITVFTTALEPDELLTAARQPLCATFMDYLLPTRADMPPVDVLVTEDAPSPRNALGVKGAGEGGTTAMGAAIAAAVAAALGVALGVVELPVRPEAVLRLAEGARAGPTSEPGGA